MIHTIKHNTEVVIYCGGWSYGLHGYKSTKCLPTRANSTEAKVVLDWHIVDKHEMEHAVLEKLPHGWFYAKGRFICPSCIKEAVNGGGPEAWSHEAGEKGVKESY